MRDCTPLTYAIATCCCCGGGGGASNRVFSAIIRPNMIPTPSITPISTPQAIALFLIALAPPRTARAAPVQKPPRIPFHGSSFFLGCPSACVTRKGLTSLDVYPAPDAFHSAVKCGEQTAPYPEVAAEDGCACFNGRDCADAPLAVWGVTARQSACADTSDTYRKPLTPCHIAPPTD
jgi:hypothetical protein